MSEAEQLTGDALEKENETLVNNSAGTGASATSRRWPRTSRTISNIRLHRASR